MNNIKHTLENILNILIILLDLLLFSKNLCVRITRGANNSNIITKNIKNDGNGTETLFEKLLTGALNVLTLFIPEIKNINKSKKLATSV